MELDPRTVDVHLSAGVQKAFGDLAAAVHFSEHVDAGIIQTLHDLAGGKALSVDDVLGGLSILAAETIKHVQATGDERPARLWREIASQLVEERFTLKARRRENYSGAHVP
jgi:hypothetical protein